jgi:hypothetical protein
MSGYVAVPHFGLFFSGAQLCPAWRLPEARRRLPRVGPGRGQSRHSSPAPSLTQKEMSDEENRHSACSAQAERSRLPWKRPECVLSRWEAEATVVSPTGRRYGGCRRLRAAAPRLARTNRNANPASSPPPRFRTRSGLVCRPSRRPSASGRHGPVVNTLTVPFSVQAG